MTSRPGWCPAPRAGTGTGATAAQPGHDGYQALPGPGQLAQARDDEGAVGAEAAWARGELGTADRLARLLACEDPDAAGLDQGAGRRSKLAGSGASGSSSPATARPAGSASPATGRKRQYRSCQTLRLLNTFFRHSPPAEN